MKKAVHFGAGNIGRGFLGQLYFESGYATTFVDVVDDVVRALQERGSYPIRIVSEEGEEVIRVEHVTAVHGNEREAVAEALVDAEIASTAVGVNALKFVAPSLAAGIARRFAQSGARPLNIIVCENLIGAGSHLRELIRGSLPQELHHALDEEVGFVEASIGRMVPVPTEEQKGGDALTVVVEPYCELPVDGEAFRGGIPDIAHMKALRNFDAYVERKLFVHNMSHSAVAYLGWLRGYEFVWEAVRDDGIKAEVDAALNESCTGLAAKHGLDPVELASHRRDLLHRYGNRVLGDPVSRVGGDPVRKLGVNDRIIGTARMCQEQNIEPRQIAFVAAAAIHFDNPADTAAQKVQEVRKAGGLEAVLAEFCGIEADSHLAGLVREGEARLRNEGWLDS